LGDGVVSPALGVTELALAEDEVVAVESEELAKVVPIFKLNWRQV
jgi:hypothetical protein